MKPDPIKKETAVSKVRSDVSRYAQMAAELGATHVKNLNVSEIMLDYRAGFKCMVPKCRHYNTNANCPPYAPSLESMEKLLSCFSMALLIGLEVSSTSVLKNTGEKNDRNFSEKTSGQRQLNRIVSLLEAEAFYDGHYFATAFGGGPCKSYLCSGLPCQVLEMGKSCRHPYHSRPSMEGVGMDVFNLVANMGWTIYPVGQRCQAEDIPFGLLVGIILIC